ncbi:isoaspartyl peptidase/L-asparaginase family protein [Elstera cyanobacteriorum]|uniref:isoaspartyl peptidase/L-asparaginase family protein n=1 Tax=Elstera cyanobacteriorum TaxID=2022747 RepID=UPI002354AF64|nr:isoaspartyl peptidase/L-asparaginase [Elstera cyanobacteriorum]MCK6444218.1 isoaspartyl peptidase/L-asparaginase [Elstera cyanobacteriorum]
MSVPFTLALHGGAGTIPSATMTPAKEAAYRAGLARALRAGYAVLENGGAALDAVTAAVCALEDDPLFNAGRGAVYTRDGTQEMDAAIMDGRDRRAGAVAGLFGPKNPILAARAVMDRTPHVLMIGAGALKIARDAGLDFGDRDYFFTQERWDALQSTLALQGRDDGDASRKHGTVGAVARDAQGNLAAATSTGGMTAKLAGRVGDSPVIGAGTFADNETCAVSATGHGELFIRWATAHEIASRMRHRSESLLVAAEHVTLHDLPKDSGGLIAVGADGSVALPFNSEGMYRGMIGAGGVAWTGIYREELVAVEG